MIYPILGVLCVAALLYSATTILVIPWHVMRMRRKGLDVWKFLTRPFLIFSALVYAIAGPVLPAMAILSGGALASGGGNDSQYPDQLMTVGLVVLGVLWAAAACALIAALVQPSTARSRRADKCAPGD